MMRAIQARSRGIRWPIGAHVFVVEWCAGCPVVDGDTDIDNGDYRSETWMDRPAARRRAQHLIDARLDFFGCIMLREYVVISHQEFESSIGDDADYDARGFYREVGEPEEFS